MVKILRIFSILPFLLFFISCENNEQDFFKKINGYADNFNKFYPDDKFVPVKNSNDGENSDFIVIYNVEKGKFSAYNLENYHKGIFFVGDFVNNLEPGVDAFHNLIPVGDGTYIGQTGMLFEETDTTSKDLETIGYFLEDIKCLTASENFVSSFGLSVGRAYEVARLFYFWNQNRSKRSLTKKDYKAFSKDLFGFDFTDAQEAYQKMIEGDSSEFEHFLDKAADKNNTSPEHLNALLKELLEQT